MDFDYSIFGVDDEIVFAGSPFRCLRCGYQMSYCMRIVGYLEGGKKIIVNNNNKLWWFDNCRYEYMVCKENDIDRNVYRRIRFSGEVNICTSSEYGCNKYQRYLVYDYIDYYEHCLKCV